jgi:hypothetical protein
MYLHGVVSAQETAILKPMILFCSLIFLNFWSLQAYDDLMKAFVERNKVWQFRCYYGYSQNVNRSASC